MNPLLPPPPGWTWDPLLISGLLGFALLYGHGLTRRHARQRDVVRVAAFLTGWLVVGIALVSPLNELGEQLFSAHMVQHVLLMVLAPPLLALSRPGAVLLAALPRPLSRGLGRLAGRTQRLWAHGRWLWSPAGAWALHAISLWVWHIPGLYDYALQVRSVHDLEHASFVLPALLFWQAMVRLSQRGQPGGVVAALYLFTTALQSGLLGVLITFSPFIWYPPYGATAPFWDVTPLADQQLAGVIMWVPAGMVYFAAALTALARGCRLFETERRVQLPTPEIVASGNG